MKKIKILSTMLLSGITLGSVIPCCITNNNHNQVLENDYELKDSIENNEIVQKTLNNNLNAEQIDNPFLFPNPITNGKYNGQDAFIINTSYNWTDELGLLIDSKHNGDKLTFKDLMDIYWEGMRYGVRLGDVQLHLENFNPNSLNNSGLEITLQNLSIKNINVNYYEVVISLKDGYLWKDLPLSSSAPIVFKVNVNNLPEYKDADVFKMFSLDYWGYLYYDDETDPGYDEENNVSVNFTVRSNWEKIRRDINEFLKDYSQNVDVVLADVGVQRSSYGWVFFVDVVPVRGHEFVESMSAYKTRRISVVLKNIHFDKDKNEVTYPKLVTRADYPWDDYYKNYKNVNNYISRINSTYDLIYTRYIVNDKNENLFDLIMKNISVIILDLKNYLNNDQAAENVEVGVIPSSFNVIDNIVSMKFFVTPKLGFHWPDGTKNTKEFYVYFENIVETPPNQFDPFNSFISLNKNRIDDREINPSKDCSSGFVDHYWTNGRVNVPTLDPTVVYDALWQVINSDWFSLQEAMRINGWKISFLWDSYCDFSLGTENYIHIDGSWTFTVFAIPKIGHAWNDGSRNAKPIRVRFQNVGGKTSKNEKYKFYADYDAKYY